MRQTRPMKKVFTLFAFAATCGVFAQNYQFTSRGVGGGGALFSPSINPANTSEYYASCDMSELFHTSNFGQSYDQVSFLEFTGGHNSKVCYTSTSGRLYSISYVNDIGTPVLSNDNGVTWTALAGNPDPNEDVYTIHADYNNSSRVIVSQYGAIFFSSNSGTTFTQIHTALNNGSGNVVGGVFFDGNNIYIGTNDGVIVSTDGGSTWNTATITGLPTSERIWSFCAAKSANTTRLFCLTGDVNDIYVGLQGSDYWGFFRNVYTCDYGVTNWSAASSGIVQNTDFPMFIDMAENDINTIYVAGSNSNGEPNIMKSVNAGSSWTHVFNTAGNTNIITGWSGQGGDRGWGYGECVFGFDVCASDADYVIFGDFGFLHTTSTGGTSWSQAYVDAGDAHAAGANTPQGAAYHSVGLENTTCWQISWSDPNNLWACFSDIRGIRSTDAGLSWSFDYTGHTANSSYRVSTMQNGTMIMACSGVHDMYQSTRLTDALLDANDPAGQLKYSTDNGATWNVLHSFNHPVYWIEIDPNNPNRAYASVIHYANGTGVGGVYRCDDLNNLAASTWTLLSDPPRTEKHPACLKVLNDGTLLATYSGRRNGSGAFTASSGVFTYNPVTGNWSDVSSPFQHYWTKDIVVDPRDTTQNTWLACVWSGWGGPPNGLGGVYRTTDRGLNWMSISGVQWDRVSSVTPVPNTAYDWFVTTETQGLWRFTWYGMSGSSIQITSYPFRQPERVFFNPYNQNEMWVTSFGNGLKVCDITTGIMEFHDPAPVVYPNPASDHFSVEGASGEQLEILDVTGKVVRSVTLVQGSNLINTQSLPAGSYFIRKGNGRASRIVVTH